MAISIYRVTPEDSRDDEVVYLCEGEWLLWPQIDALCKWLAEDGLNLQPARYVADIGFCWRRDASSGGPVLDSESMRQMADLGISLYFSEYLGFGDTKEEE